MAWLGGCTEHRRHLVYCGENGIRVEPLRSSSSRYQPDCPWPHMTPVDLHRSYCLAPPLEVLLGSTLILHTMVWILVGIKWGLLIYLVYVLRSRGASQVKA